MKSITVLNSKSNYLAKLSQYGIPDYWTLAFFLINFCSATATE